MKEVAPPEKSDIEKPTPTTVDTETATAAVEKPQLENEVINVESKEASPEKIIEEKPKSPEELEKDEKEKKELLEKRQKMLADLAYKTGVEGDGCGDDDWEGDLSGTEKL